MTITRHRAQPCPIPAFGTPATEGSAVTSSRTGAVSSHPERRLDAAAGGVRLCRRAATAAGTRVAAIASAVSAVTAASRRLGPGRLTMVADLAAVLLFALEGALLGAAAGLSVFGVLVVSFISSLGGGIIRDLLIHATPPAALRCMAYPVTAFLGGLLVVGGHDILHDIPASIRIPLDAAALGLFCAAGAAKALDHGMKPFPAVLMGTISATGGGVIRDILIHEVPVALRVDIYAIAAALGAAVVVTGVWLGLPRQATLLLGIATCFGLRVISVLLGWELPQLAG